MTFQLSHQPTRELSIIIATHNRLEKLKNCLNAIERSSYSLDQSEIIVVDDGHTPGLDHFLENAAHHIPHLRLLRQEHKGPGPARNLGVMNSKGKLIVFTDDDCIVDQNWLQNIVHQMQDPAIGGLGGKVVSQGNDLVNQFMDLSRSLTPRLLPDGTASYLVTANACYRRQIFEKIGGFDDELFLYATGEDVDFSLRVQQAGFKLVYSPECLLQHDFDDSLISLLRRFYWYGEGIRRVFDKHHNGGSWNPDAEVLLFWLIVLGQYGSDLREFVEIKDRHMRLWFSLLFRFQTMMLLFGYVRVQKIADLFALMKQNPKRMAMAHMLKSAKKHKRLLDIGSLELLMKNQTDQVTNPEVLALFERLDAALADQDTKSWVTTILNHLEFDTIFQAIQFGVRLTPSRAGASLSKEEINALAREKEEQDKLYEVAYEQLYATLADGPQADDLDYIENLCDLRRVNVPQFLMWREKRLASNIPDASTAE